MPERIRKGDTMFGFSKKSNKKAKDETVSANEFLKNQPNNHDEELIETELSIPDDWNISNEDRYVFAFHNSQSPKLKVNQISIYGMELDQTEQGYLATGLIRSTVQQPIQFQPTVILLLGPDQEVIARKEFDLEPLGVIPPNRARPWKFHFKQEDMLKTLDEPLKEWSLAFELKQEHQLDLEESWEKSIAEETKLKLQEIVANAKPLKPGEVNFMGLSAKLNDNGDLAVTILIRNGADKHITLEQIPLGVKDASQEEIARGGFKLDNFTVKANTSKPWTFIFPKSMIKKKDIDLSRWQVYPIQN